jgi:hypothetical protein
MELPLVACVSERRTGVPEAFGRASLRDDCTQVLIGHPLQGATWQPVANAAAYSVRFPLGNSLILNRCRNW